MVLKGELDFALIEGSAHSPAVVYERFSDDHLVVVCGGSHPFSVRREITLEELLTCDFLLREKGSGTRELWTAFCCCTTSQSSRSGRAPAPARWWPLWRGPWNLHPSPHAGTAGAEGEAAA